MSALEIKDLLPSDNCESQEIKSLSSGELLEIRGGGIRFLGVYFEKRYKDKFKQGGNRPFFSASCVVRHTRGNGQLTACAGACLTIGATWADPASDSVSISEETDELD